MNRVSKKRRINLSRFQAILLMFGILCLMNLPLAIARYKINQDSINIHVELITIVMTLLLLFLLSLNSLLFKVSCSLIMLINSLFLYYVIHNKILVTSEVIDAIFNTDNSEAVELLNLDIILWITITLGLLIAFNKYIAINQPISKYGITAAYVLAILILIYSCSVTRTLINYDPDTRRSVKTGIHFYFPFNYIFHSASYAQHTYKKLFSDSKNHCEINIDLKDNKDLTLVLVIGESARADSFSLNGYHRNTTPLLSTVKNLVSFTDVFALGSETLTAVPKLFQNTKKEFCLIEALNKSSFYTKWVSANSSAGNIKTLQTKMAEVISRTQALAGLSELLDGRLIDFIHNSNHYKRNFYVFHTRGSHFNYDRRVTKDFIKFTPICADYTGDCTNKPEFLRNSYDNSILYTDYFLYNLIKKIESENALVIYISDHGEALGEDGIFSHAHPMEIAPKSVLHIPMIWWASDKFLKNPENLKRFQNLALNKNKYADQSYIFHSILDCIGAESSTIDKNKSICH